MSNNRLYDTSKVKIIKIPAAMNYGMRKDTEITASSKDGANRGQRTPYARTSKKKGGSIKTKPKRSPVRKKQMEEYQKYLYDASQANKPVTKPSVMKKGGRVGSHNRLY